MQKQTLSDDPTLSHPTLVRQTTGRTLVLASTSPYRRELLARLGLPFDAASPGIDETPFPNESAADTCLRLAIAKAQALANSYPDALLIGSDQVALLDRVQLGKPGNHERAMLQLKTMRGKMVEFHTALALHDTASGQTLSSVDVTRVTMREYSDAQINAYLHREQPYDCAGSAKVEALGIAMINKVESVDPTALIGLPLISLVTMLSRAGVEVI